MKRALLLVFGLVTAVSPLLAEEVIIGEEDGLTKDPWCGD